MKYTERAHDCPERLRAVYEQAAGLHLRMHERQIAAAQLHEIYADRLEQQLTHEWPAPPSFMAAVAQTLGVPGAAAALYGPHSRTPVLVTASDPTAQAAYNLEAALGEGPVTTTATEGKTVRADGTELSDRWPWYGPAANRLGIRSVLAVPLQVPAFRLGALCCYGDKPSTGHDTAATVETVAWAVAPILLRTASGKSLLELMEPPRSVRDN